MQWGVFCEVIVYQVVKCIYIYIYIYISCEKLKVCENVRNIKQSINNDFLYSSICQVKSIFNPLEKGNLTTLIIFY